jgi:hypothetical protein
MENHAITRSWSCHGNEAVEPSWSYLLLLRAGRLDEQGREDHGNVVSESICEQRQGDPPIFQTENQPDSKKRAILLCSLMQWLTVSVGKKDEAVKRDSVPKPFVRFC